MSTDKPQLVYLGLGSNIGDRCLALQTALQPIDRLLRTTVLRCSHVYETEPWGETNQDPFYNAAVEIQSALEPEALLLALKTIERSMGRVTTVKNGPRLIDIDILLYGDVVLNRDHIAIPHPMLAQRKFVLSPLCEMAGDVLHPVEQVTSAELARVCTDSGRIWIREDCTALYRHEQL